MIKQNQEISEQTNDAILHGSTILLYQVKKYRHFCVLTSIIVVASALVLSHILFNCFIGPIRNMVLYNRSAFNTFKSHFIFSTSVLQITIYCPNLFICY